ncbi:MAG: hypothetical protein WC477_07455 [Patescibacteria group bacterium]
MNEEKEYDKLHQRLTNAHAWIFVLVLTIISLIILLGTKSKEGPNPYENTDVQYQEYLQNKGR